MKNSIITLLLFCTSMVFCQERIIDWQSLEKINDVKKLLDPVKNKTFATFTITNINKFLYKVEISGKGFDLETPIPTELQALFRLTPDEKTAITNNDKVAKAAKDIKNQNNVMSDISDDINTKSILRGTKTSIKENLLRAKIAVLNPKCNEYYKKAAELSARLFKLKVLKVDFINIAQMDDNPTVIKNKVQDLGSVPSPVIIFEDFLKLYADVEQLYDEAEKLAIGEDLVKIKEAIEKIEKSFEVFKEENILSLYSELTFLQNELVDNSNFIVQAPPIQMTGDFVAYKCKITPSKTNLLGAYRSPVEINFIIPNKSGLKVDFSVGPTVSLGKGAKDEKYFLEESTTIGKSYLRQRDNNNAGVPGLAAMMHIYDRVATETAIGGLFGVGAGFQSIEDVDLSFYLGASIILGKKQKVMINTGLSFLRVDRLKEKEFEVGKEYTTQDFVINDVVEKVFKPSFFISLSYSLAKRVDN